MTARRQEQFLIEPLLLCGTSIEPAHQLADEMDPENFVSLLRRFVDAVTDRVRERGGCVVEHSGNVLVSAWRGSRDVDCGSLVSELLSDLRIAFIGIAGLSEPPDVRIAIARGRCAFGLVKGQIGQVLGSPMARVTLLLTMTAGEGTSVLVDRDSVELFPRSTGTELVEGVFTMKPPYS
jgi:class 3 adenylate cyclase